MPKIKSHLKNVYRTIQGNISRKDFMRMDMNESINGLPGDFVKSVIANIKPELLAMYPEYHSLQNKIGIYNNLSYENICLSNGSDSAIKYIFDAYVSSKDNILLTDPTFAMYLVYCNIFNARATMVEYNPDFTFPKERFIEKISPSVKLAVVVNPNNPTGTILSHEDLIRIIRKARDNDVLVIVDEAYFYFYSGTLIDEVKRYNNLIVLRTFSKLCGIASARLGYIAACPEIIENIRRVKPTYDVNGLGVLFAEKILDDPYIIQSLVRGIDEGKRFLIQKLSEENIEYRDGYANFVLVNCGDRADKIVKSLAEKNILVSGGFRQNFLKEYIRVTVGDRMIMEQFWRSFVKIWKDKDRES